MDLPVFQLDGGVSAVQSPELVNYVLEVNAGVCEEYGIEEGDEIIMKY